MTEEHVSIENYKEQQNKIMERKDGYKVLIYPSELQTTDSWKPIYELEK